METAADTRQGFRFVEDREKDIHAYFLDGKPMIGTTTVLNKTLPKELTWWASGMACSELGWKNPRNESAEACLVSAAEKLEMIKKLGAEEYVALLNKAYRAHNARKEKAKTKGIDTHAMLEEFIRAAMNGKTVQIDPVIKPFVLWAKTNVKRFLFAELCCYSRILWCGGTADFGYEDLAGNLVLGDFKSAEKAYFSYWVQVGGYDKQISENGGFTREGEKIFTLEKPFAYYAIFGERAGLDQPFFSHKTDLLRRVFGNVAAVYKDMMAFEGK